MIYQPDKNYKIYKFILDVGVNKCDVLNEYYFIKLKKILIIISAVNRYYYPFICATVVSSKI